MRDRKIRIRVQRKNGRTGSEVIVQNDYSYEVGKESLLKRTSEEGLFVYVVFCNDTDLS